MGLDSAGAALVSILVVAVTALPFVLVDREKRLSRGAYLIRTLAALAVLGTVGIFATSVVGGRIGAAATLLCGMAVAASTLSWSIYRTQDIGWSRWLNLLIVVPMANLAWIAVLCIALPRTKAGA